MRTAHPQIQAFLNYIRFEKRYSQNTFISYETDLIHFFDYLQLTYGAVTLPGVSHLYIRSWLAGLKEEGCSAKTINRKIASLRSFFKYELKRGTVDASPMGKIIAPKPEKRLPNFVAEKDMGTLFNYVTFTDDRVGKTEKLVLQLLYNTGIRLSELINLEESNISFSSATIRVLGKGAKERILPVSPALLNDIRDYSALKKTGPGSCSSVLLVNEKGKKLYPKAVYTIVKKYLSLVTTIEKRSPHVLRHTFATHLTNNGAELNAVKELLGHTSLAATQVYTHNTIDKLKNVYKKAHPKA